MIDPSAWQPRAATLFAGAALVWAVSLYGLFVDERLVYALALVPRRIDGLPGILSAPLVHGSFAHLLANTVPLLILGGLVVIRGVASYLTTTLAIIVLGGLGLWVLGRDAAHIGASGLIFRLLRLPWSAADTTNAGCNPSPYPSWSWWCTVA